MSKSFRVSNVSGDNMKSDGVSMVGHGSVSTAPGSLRTSVFDPFQCVDHSVAPIEAPKPIAKSKSGMSPGM